MACSFKIRWLFGGFVVTLALVVGLNFVSYNMAQSSRESNVWLDHTNEVKHAIDDLKQIFEQADLEQRERVSYGGSSVAATSNLRPRVWATFDKVQQLTIDNSEQQVRLDSLRRIVGRRFEIFDGLIRIGESQGTDAAIAQTLKLRTLDDLREIENGFAAVRAEEWRLYYERMETARVWRQKIGSLGFVVFGLIYLVIPLWFYAAVKTVCAKAKAAQFYKSELRKAKRSANKEILLDEGLANEILEILEDTKPAAVGGGKNYVN